MWKITYLKLVNFAYIYTGMRKTQIELDFSNCDKKVNVFIGKMGSGKSSILGHLQPFAEYGTLDVRNGKDQILPEEEGLKEIHYLHLGHTYEIQHIYSWNKRTESHSTKSYIQKDGEELNPNGNTGSFKEIIRTEFGIDPSFLRILRLGPNVANIVSMKSTERKAFIASLLKETEIYAYVYKQLQEDYRNANAALQVLSNKLYGLSSSKEEDMKLEAESLKDDIDVLTREIENLKASIARLSGINQTLMKDIEGDPHEALRQFALKIRSSKDEISRIEESLQALPNETIQNLSIQFGEFNSQITSLNEEILRLQVDNEETDQQINRFEDFLLLQSNNVQMEQLERQAAIIETDYRNAEKRLEGFSTQYSYLQLSGLISTIEAFQLSLDEMCNNNERVISQLLNSDDSIKSYTQKRLEILTARQSKLTKLLSNIDFSQKYTSPITLYRPPCCPTEDCPYIQSHPVTIAEVNESKSKVDELLDEIDRNRLEIEICESTLSEYPKMVYLRKSWSQISEILDNLGVLNTKSFKRLLLDLNARISWYDHAELLHYAEKCKLFESFNDLKNRYQQVQSELQSMRSSDVEMKRKELEDCKTHKLTNLNRMVEIKDRKDHLSREKARVEEMLRILSSKSQMEMDLSTLNMTLSQQENDLIELQGRMKEYDNNQQEKNVLQAKLDILSREFSQKNERYGGIQRTLQDIRSTSEIYEQTAQEVQELKLILSAVSSKDGVPLIMVKVFLDQCREIVNDLISDIFEDDLQILDFQISEENNDFKIPYSINGAHVPDIEMASQGQQSVITIALSFALSRRSMFDYNIPLFDEVDNSIYRSDRERFITIVMKQMMEIKSEQMFMITHNDIFQQSGLPVNIIMTTPEVVDKLPNQSIMRLY